MTTSTRERDAVPSVGAPLDRVDGRLKVTGGARYSAELPVPNVAYAVIVASTVPVGRIAGIDTRAARAVPGVIRVMTHLDTPKLPMKKTGMLVTSALSLTQDDRVRYNGQPIALVVADTLERATDAASLVKVRYGGTTKPTLDMHAVKGSGYAPPPGFGGQPDSKRGDIRAGLAQADVEVDARYTTPIENHNPMEPHATIAAWEGDRLTVRAATQYVMGDRDLGEIRIPHIVAAYGAGKILNAKTARSQLRGGIVRGIGMALQEETLVDRHTGRYINADLAEYHVPVHADIGTIDVAFVDEVDPYVNPIGVKGIGEIGITGVAASIANAVYSATGVRVRELPITLDKVLGGRV